MSLGDSTYFLGHRLGFFGALTYDRKFSFYEEGRQGRYLWPTGHEDEPGQPSVRANLNDTRAIDEISWGTSVSLAYELHPGHQLGFNFLYAQNGEDQARRRIGIAGIDNIEKGSVSYINELHWTERNLNAYQFNGKHTLEELGGIKFDWLYSLANTTQDEPDYRLFNFAQTPEGTINVSGTSGAPEPAGGPTRYFRNLEEDTSTIKMDFTIPFRQWREEEGQFKVGAYRSTSQRDFRERTYTFKPQTDVFGGDPLLFPNTFASDQQLRYEPVFSSRGQLIGYRPVTSFTDELGNSFLDGHQEIRAFYGMATLPVSDKLRLIGGVRHETTDLHVDSFSRLRGAGTGEIKEGDLLPAAGFIYALRTNMNLRFNFAQTVARPTFREFSNLRSYDVTGDEIFVGNTNLTMSHIDNFDLRWEWYPRSGELLSVSAFYKEIERPIERIAIDGSKGDEITYTNFPFAKVYGVEFEARTTLDWLERHLSDFSMGLSLSLIKSESENVETVLITKRPVGFPDKTRPLFDQSPYIITADLTYDNRYLGTTVTLAYSVFGERLYLVNNAGADVYEQPAAQLDLILSQRLNRNWRIKFAAKNLLDPRFERVYGRRGELDEKLVYSTYTKGRTFSFSLSYDF